MRPCFTALIVVLFLSFLFHPADTGSAEEGLSEVTAIALRNWPPHYQTVEKTGEPVGFAIDVMDRIASLSRIHVRYVVYNDWPEAFEALEKRQALLAPNLGITDERLGLYDFTVPYETFRISIFVRESTVDIHGIEDLDGRDVGVVQKNQGAALMRHRGTSRLQVFDSMEEAFLGLLAGRVEALVYPEPLIRKMAIQSGLEGKIKTVGEPLQEIKRSMAVRKGEPELFSRLDTAVRQFIASPEYREIYETWHGKPKPFWNAVRVAVLMGILMGAALAGMMVWRYVSVLRLNRSLSEAEERLRGIVEKSHAGYFFIDRDGLFQDVNRAWLDMHGYDSPNEIIGKPFTLTQVDTYRDTAERDVAALLRGEPIPAGSATRLRRDGSVGHHTFSAQPVVRGGRVVGLEGFIIDTTEQDRVEQEKRDLETRLWRIEKAESLHCMAGAVAHHFNNMLSVVIGNLELAMENSNLPEEDRDALGEAMEAARRAAEISAFMLTYAGHVQERRGVSDLARVCSRTLTELHNTIPGGIRLAMDLPTSPLTPVRVDPDLIRQVVTHLVANAREAVEEGEGEIRVAVRTTQEVDLSGAAFWPADWTPAAGPYAVLEVSDTGKGMSAEDLRKVMDPFFSTKFTGRGIGLPLVLGIARVHGGAVAVESGPGLGSTFRILFPLAEPGNVVDDTRG